MMPTTRRAISDDILIFFLLKPSIVETIYACDFRKSFEFHGKIADTSVIFRVLQEGRCT